MKEIMTCMKFLIMFILENSDLEGKEAVYQYIFNKIWNTKLGMTSVLWISYLFSTDIQEMQTIIKNLTNSSAGWDYISPSVLKYIAPYITKALVN